MSLYWLFLIIPVTLLVLLFIIYFLNLDMKLVAVIYNYLGKRFDNEKRETSL
jgi:membrane-associated PAP2 superfamily phosphatase